MSGLEELRALIDGAHGEAIEAPHPNQFRNTVMTPLTPWVRSELPSDFKRTDHGAVAMVEDDRASDYGRPLTYIQGQIVQMVLLDEYDEPVGPPAYVMQSRVMDPQQKNKDISSHAIDTMGTKDLRKRFPAAFAAFEKAMKPADLPIVLLDTVPPYVVLHLQTQMGVKTIADFAAFDDEMMATLRGILENYKMHARVPYLNDYRQRARDRVGYKEPKLKTEKAAA